MSVGWFESIRQETRRMGSEIGYAYKKEVEKQYQQRIGFCAIAALTFFILGIASISPLGRVLAIGVGLIFGLSGLQLCVELQNHTKAHDDVRNWFRGVFGPPSTNRALL